MANDELGERMAHLEGITTTMVLPSLERLEEKMDKALTTLGDTPNKESVFALQLALEKKADKEEVGKLKETIFRWTGAIGVIVFILSMFGKQIVDYLIR